MNWGAFSTDVSDKSDNGSNATRSNVTQALQIIHDSRSDNDTRQRASAFLESQKQSKEAAQHGFNLAAEKSQPPVVRHFGLSLLEDSVRHHWSSFSDAQVLDMRNWTIALSQSISEDEPLYLRNKVAQLLLEVAKKDWAVSWYDMDSLLLALWNQNPTLKELVLTVLENLSEDVFTREDAAAGLRGQDLNNAVVEIFTPASAVAGGQNKGRHHIRANADGWLARISHLLANAFRIGSDKSTTKACVCKALATLRSAFTWVMGPAIITTNCLEHILACFLSNDTDVLVAAIEALHSLYGRTHLEKSEFTAFVSPMLQIENVSLLRRLHDWSMVSYHDIETSRYTFSKKFSETIAFIAGHVEECSASELSSVDLSHFFRFMIGVSQHLSLVVSIPVLHAWVKILKSQHTGNLEATWSVIGPLLDTASQRIIRYELLPEDSDEPSIVFLNEDIDTIPERHAFLGNYRRFCYQIIEIVAQRKPREAISHILSQVDVSLDAIAAETPPLDPATYMKSSTPLLRLDAHLTVVEAALKGYSKWVSDHGKQPQKDEQERNFLESNIESWAGSLLTDRKFEDPLMKQRIIKLAVECSARALERNQAFALKVLEHILMTQAVDRPEYPAYSEAARELQVYATSELRRLACRHADYFATFYDQLESKIREVLSTSTFDEKAEAEMYGTLLIVLQRATNLDLTTRNNHLQNLIGSMLQGWQSERLDRLLSSFEEFCRLLGIDRVGAYLQSKQISGASDWSAIQLDPSGLSIQSDMNQVVSEVPLRMTKTALGVMTDKLAEDSEPYLIAVNIWAPRIPMLLPKVLRLIEYAHRLHDVDSWPNLPPEMEPIIGRVLQDRFWQAGISTGSRDDFYSRVTNTKTSLEGFASFVRGKIRLIREACYQILHSMSRLGDHFYSYAELPEPLAESLIGSTTDLSPHQFSVLLQMIRSLVDDCPKNRREHVLPPVLSTLFEQIDRKITSEWEKIEGRKVDNTGEENLTLEMKEESILRQLTYAAVTFIAVLLDPFREEANQSSTSTSHPNQPQQPQEQQQQQQQPQTQPHEKTPRSTLRKFILSNPPILSPLLLFCTHALTIPDSRSTSTITKVLRTIVPVFAALSAPDTPTTASVREYIATAVLKAAITSLHDGYFADLHKELAGLIATVWVAYGCVTHFPAVTTTTTTTSTGQAEDEGGAGTVVITPAYDRPPLSPTPREIILSLPHMTAQRVDAVVAALTATGGWAGHTRQQRALVLDLLDGLRGVRVSELGRMDAGREVERTRLQERYLRVVGEGGGRRRSGEGVQGEVGEAGGTGGEVDVGDGPDLGGVGELLG